MAEFKPQTENLYRGLVGGFALRDQTRDDEQPGETGGDGTADTAGTTMVGHFAVFNEWTEICSWYEGEFLERIAPGAFKSTMRDNRNTVKVQYDHGYNESVGSSPLGVIDVLQEDEVGAYYEVPLYDTGYNRDTVLPLLQGRLMDGTTTGSALGASFRFSVAGEAWDMEPKVSAYNPKGLPERTITKVRLFEFGPVVFPAYPSATAAASAGMRSLTDHYLDRVRARSAKFAGIAGTAELPSGGSAPTPDTEGLPSGGSTEGRKADPRLLRIRAVLATH